MAPAWVGKTYSFVSQENVENYLERTGVTKVYRKMAASYQPITTLTQEGDFYILKLTSPEKNWECKFKPGVEFEDITPDNRKVMSTFTFAGENKLILTQVGEKNTAVQTREFTESELLLTFQCEDVIAVRRYAVV